MLALVPDPTVVTHAGAVDALPGETVAIAGNGRGSQAEHEVQHHEYSQVGFPHVPRGAGPGAGVSPSSSIHDGPFVRDNELTLHTAS